MIWTVGAGLGSGLSIVSDLILIGTVIATSSTNARADGLTRNHGGCAGAGRGRGWADVRSSRPGARGRRVLLLDHADKPGKKILISGGGRCNFTNRAAGPENFLSANPHFARSALARYTAADFLALVEAHGIPYHEKTLGQLFCDRSAQDIVNMLLRECARAGVRIQLGTRVVGAARRFDAGLCRRFRVETSARDGLGGIGGSGDRRAVDPEDGGDGLRV